MIDRREFVVGSVAGSLASGTPVFAPRARADTAYDVKIARQIGIGHLPLMIMEDQGLLQKEAASRGVSGVTASYLTLAGGAAMNDALLSGAIQFAAGGIPPLVLLWSKTRNSSRVIKGVSAMNSIPLQLNTTNPKVRTLRDFSDGDKIALPAVKISVQAMFLQMAAEQQLGPGHANDLDHLTVTLNHPDGMAAMFAGQVDAHFTAPPTQEFERKRTGVHMVLDTFEVLGAPSTFNVVWGSSIFVDRNPEIYAAFVAALGKAVAIINADKKAAAATYVRLSNDADDLGLITDILANPRVTFTTIPQGIGAFTSFMVRANTIRTGPKDWKELFFPNIHTAAGN